MWPKIKKKERKQRQCRALPLFLAPCSSGLAVGLGHRPHWGKIFFSSTGMVDSTAGTAQRLCMHAESLQSCPTLCNPMDCSLPGAMQTSKREIHWEDPMGAVKVFPHAAPAESSTHLTWALGPQGLPTLSLVPLPLIPGVVLKALRTPSRRRQERITFWHLHLIFKVGSWSSQVFYSKLTALMTHQPLRKSHVRNWDCLSHMIPTRQPKGIYRRTWGFSINIKYVKSPGHSSRGERRHWVLC